MECTEYTEYSYVVFDSKANVIAVYTAKDYAYRLAQKLDGHVQICELDPHIGTSIDGILSS
jgi:hypothetical protein